MFKEIIKKKKRNRFLVNCPPPFDSIFWDLSGLQKTFASANNFNADILIDLIKFLIEKSI